MNLYIDCEWNDWQGELMSMALVAESGGAYWYGEFPIKAHPSAWIAQHVVPNLRPELVSSDPLQTFLHRWPFRVNIVADWPEDVAWFCRHIVYPRGKRMATPPLSFVVDRGLDSSGSALPHNALADAVAMCRMDGGRPPNIEFARAAR